MMNRVAASREIADSNSFTRWYSEERKRETCNSRPSSINHQQRALINYRSLANSLCDKDKDLSGSLACFSVCSHPDKMSVSLFTLRSAPARRWIIWVASTWEEISIKRPKQKTFTFESFTENGDRRWWCKPKWPSAPLSVIVALHQTLLFTIWMWNSTIDDRSSVIKYRIEFTRLRLSPWRSAGVLMSRLLSAFIRCRRSTWSDSIWSNILISMKILFYEQRSHKRFAPVADSRII